MKTLQASLIFFCVIATWLPSLIMASTYQIEEFPVCTQDDPQSHPAVSGAIVVWEDGRDTATNYADIYGYNCSTRQEFPVSTSPTASMNPDISGSIIVYQKYVLADYGNADVYSYNMLTHTETCVWCSGDRNDELPAISGNIVALWRPYHIAYVDISSGQTHIITEELAGRRYPDASGSIIVWDDHRNGNRDIYAYSLITGNETAICANTAEQQYPSVSGNVIVWQDHREGTWDIYAYNLQTQIEYAVCNQTGDQTNPAVCGNIVVWQDSRSGNSDIYGYDLSSKTEFAVCVHDGSQTSPAVNGNRVVWQDNRNGNEDIYGAYLVSQSSTVRTYQGYLQEDSQPVNGVYDFCFRLFDAPDPNVGMQLNVLFYNDVAVCQGQLTLELDFGDVIPTATATWIETSLREGASGGSYVSLRPLEPYTSAGSHLVQIPAGAITTSKLADLAVSEEKLSDSSVSQGKIKPSAVSTEKLQTAAVTEEKLSTGSVTKTKIAAASVDSEKITDESITPSKLATGAVQTVGIAPKAVTQDKIADAAVGQSALAAQAVSEDKIADGAVKPSKLAAGAVTEEKIGSAAVSSRTLQNNAVTFQHLAQGGAAPGQVIKWNGSAWNASGDLMASGGTITEIIATEGLTGGGTEGSVELSIANFGVTTSKLDPNAVTTEKIASQAVQFHQIARQSATDGQVIKWNSSLDSWTAAQDNTGTADSGWVHEMGIVRLAAGSDQVGIGVPEPQAKLHVQGSMIISDKATMGYNNTNSGLYAYVAGSGNTILGDYTTVSGGTNNNANGSYAAIPGGKDNRAHGNYSFAAGHGARAQHNGSVVLAANSVEASAGVESGGVDQMVLYAANGLYITRDLEIADYVPNRLINTSTGAYLSNGGNWTNACDEQRKENFEPVDTSRILERLMSVPILEWNFKTDPASTRHLGPTAQTFYKAFSLGEDDKHIGTIDADGVALASVQELHRLLLAQKAEIEALKVRLADLESQTAQTSTLHGKEP